MILGQVNELNKSVNVFFYQIFALIPTCPFKSCEGQELFVLQAEIVHEVSLEGVPVQVVRPSGLFTSEHLISEPSGSVRLEE